MKLGNLIKKTALILSLSALASACSFEMNDNLNGELDNGYKKVKGSVSRVLNLIIPSAYAEDASICRSKASSGATNVMSAYMNVDGVETKLCDTDILSNGEFEFEVKEALVPAGASIVFKASFNGAEKEKIASLEDLSSGKKIEVNSLTTMVSHSVKESGQVNSKKMKLAEKLVKSIFGEDLAKGSSEEALKFMKEATTSSLYKQKAKEFLVGDISEDDSHFVNLQTQFRRVLRGNDVKFSENLLSNAQSSLSRYAYYKRNHNPGRRTQGYWAHRNFRNAERKIAYVNNGFSNSYNSQVVLLKYKNYNNAVAIVKSIMGITTSEAKNIVNNLPQVIVSKVSYKKGEDVVKQLADQGASAKVEDMKL